MLDIQSFEFLVSKFAPSFNESETRKLWKSICPERGQKMSYNQFKRAFQWEIPDGSFEVEGLRRIREWMNVVGFSSEQAFQHLSQGHKYISKQEFMDRISGQRLLGFTAAEMDVLFKYFDTDKKRKINFQQWNEKIYEDAANPLAMMREVIKEYQLDSDELLHKMGLRIWDEPLDSHHFKRCLHALDPTLTDLQIFQMAAQMKNSQNKVEVMTLIQNLCGNDYETYDFRNRVFQRIYDELRSARHESKLREAFGKHDRACDGTLSTAEMRDALTDVITSVDEKSIEKFIKFLEKDKRGRVDYTKFLDSMYQVSNKNHNPFQSVIKRLTYFMKQNNLNLETLLRKIAVSEKKEHEGDQETEGPYRAISVAYFAKFLKNKVDKKREANELERYALLMDIDQDGFIDINDLNTCVGNINNDFFCGNNGQNVAAGTMKSFKTSNDLGTTWCPKEKMDIE